MARPFATARPVGEGAKLAIVAPSGPFDRALFERGVERLRTRYEVVFDASLHDKHGYLAGSDDRRASELLAALDDPSVDAIVCARGGYGATRILEEIPVERVARARKRLVGFSDVTALHALYAKAELQSLHAAMVAGLGRGDDAAFARWVQDLEQGVVLPSPTGAIRPGHAEGVLVGGNLAVITSLVGTPHALDTTDRVLFLEDIGERPYRVDRMLTQLAASGTFDRAAAVLVGQFTDCQPGVDGRTVDEVIVERLSRLRVPVLVGLPVGHGEPNHALPLGTVVRVEGSTLLPG